jgi:hydroxypyruvate reductase
MRTITSSSLRAQSQGERIVRVLEAALRSAEPCQAVRSHLCLQDDQLLVGGSAIDLKTIRHIWVIGAGKAGFPMAQAAVELLGDRISGGLVIVKDGYGGELPPGCPVRIVEAGHPLPDERGVHAAQEMMQLLRTLHSSDLVLCLISGGGSALIASPAAQLSLSDLQSLTGELLRCGAPIQELNIIRKHLENLKGGGLARLAAPARIVSLILSDVIGDALESIASGPCVPDPSSYSDALEILGRYQIIKKTPPAVLSHLQRGLRAELPETPKPGEAVFEKVQNIIVGSNLLAVQAALEQASSEGFNCLLLTTSLQGEARQAGRFLASIARQAAQTGDPLARPACIITGGETTVTVTGNGQGGRNQELALGALVDLAGLPDTFLVSLATDGGDGPTDAAGAVVCGSSLARARQLALDPVDFLKRNDAYPFFAALDDLIKPGPTRTNVNDLTFIFTL